MKMFAHPVIACHILYQAVGNIFQFNGAQAYPEITGDSVDIFQYIYDTCAVNADRFRDFLRKQVLSPCAEAYARKDYLLKPFF